MRVEHYNPNPATPLPPNAYGHIGPSVSDVHQYGLDVMFIKTEIEPNGNDDALLRSWLPVARKGCRLVGNSLHACTPPVTSRDVQ